MLEHKNVFKGQKTQKMLFLKFLKRNSKIANSKKLYQNIDKQLKARLQRFS